MPRPGPSRRLSVANAFSLAFLICGAIVIVAYGWFVTHRETMRLEESVRDDLVAMGAALEPAVAEVRERDGDARALQVVERADTMNQEVRIRWTWLDVPSDHADAAHPGAGAAGRAVTTTFVALEPDQVTRRVFVVAKLATAPGARPAALELSRAVVQEGAVVRDAILSEVAAAAVIALLTAIVARFVGQWLIGRPLDRVIAQARAIGAGNFDNRLKPRGTAEIFALKSEINAMCDQLRAARDKLEAETQARVETLEQLRHADRLRTVGTLSSGLAHELGTPLNVILLRAKMIKREGGKVAESAEVIAGQAERMTRIVRQLLDFARRRSPRRTKVDLAEVAEHTTTLLSSLAERTRITLRIERPETPVLVEIDPAQIEQALTNLVVNAVQASPPGAEVVVSAETREVPSEKGEPRVVACLAVRDHGAGIPKENLDRVFEPFFTTKDVGEGTGLGLAVAHGIVNDHGGFIRAESESGSGSTFSIFVPLEPT